MKARNDLILTPVACEDTVERARRRAFLKAQRGLSSARGKLHGFQFRRTRCCIRTQKLHSRSARRGLVCFLELYGALSDLESVP